MMRVNRRGVSMMIVYALIAILVGYATFTVVFNVYKSIISGGEKMQEATMCNLLLSVEGATDDSLTKRFAISLGKSIGLIPPTSGACGKTVVVNPVDVENRPSTPAPEKADAVLASLADEVNNCWKRSRVATGVTFTCVYSFKFRLSEGAITECMLTYKICDPNGPTKFREWRADIEPGNPDGCAGFSCPGGGDDGNIHVYDPENSGYVNINDNQVHSLKIYYEDGVVKIAKHY